MIYFDLLDSILKRKIILAENKILVKLFVNDSRSIYII